MTDIKILAERVVRFRDRRDWKQFHNPKDVALSLMLEAAEVAEHFQWKNDAEVKEYVERNREAIGAELADVLYWVLLLSHDLHIDLEAAFRSKMKSNAEKYPIKKSKGVHLKYNRL